ncbi:hypothetical protein MF271_16610 [Deinococcus sp. KNUC1210]|uniref:hypothetical protein n=1 Tax=Deinococcus sp. KNUC1210 TaxID=2917691 RepID=UPI001EF10893|nr:hypothetical protein [Deinococcus sp. KNUC1210]ULH15513.1 hypothetical protein MF271_16610 [Deinococcus sp. KNUC1210]
MPHRAAVLPALTLLCALLAACNPEPSPPDPPARLALTSVHMIALPSDDWKPSNETVYVLTSGPTGEHLATQATLESAQATLTLPLEAELSSALSTVEAAASDPGVGCTLTPPGAGGYSVPTFKTASVVFAAKTATSSTGYRALQDAALTSGGNHQLLFVDRDVKVAYSTHCVKDGRTDDTILALDLVHGWNLVTTMGGGNGNVYHHRVDAVPASSRTVLLNLTGSLATGAPLP